MGGARGQTVLIFSPDMCYTSQPKEVNFILLGESVRAKSEVVL